MPWEAVRQCFRNIIPAKAGIQKSACPLDPGLKNAGTSFAGMTTEGTVPILRHPLGTGRAEISVKHLMGFFGADRVSEIRTTRISKYIESRLDEDASNATINRELTVLKQMLNLGAKSTPPKVDRVPRIPMLRENNVRKGFFEYREFLRLRDELPRYLCGLVTFAFKTGWKKGGILSLEWSQVVLEAGTVRLEPGMTKNGQGRTVYLDDELKEVVEKQRDPQKEAGKLTA